jgi:nucleotide-binding universal stress UspA family protein
MMYQKILVPLDGSALAECVLAHLETLARGCQVKNVVLARVVEPFHLPTGDYVMDPEQVKKFETEHKLAAETYLKTLAAKTNYAGVNLKTEVLYGMPADVLAEYATKNQVDLILIATHGRSGPSRWVWGSVADRILRSACTPVFMVRAPGCFPGI